MTVLLTVVALLAYLLVLAELSTRVARALFGPTGPRTAACALALYLGFWIPWLVPRG